LPKTTLKARPAALALAKEYGVDVQEGSLGGVRVYTLTPEKLAKDKAGKVIFYIHGGGYILGHGVAGIGEAVLLCARRRPKFVGGSRAVYNEKLL
jgi:monoterpene epsilon-lactone hydrolase